LHKWWKKTLTGVRLGEWDSSNNPDCIDEECAESSIDFKVESITMHENYDPGTEHNDIALVRLAKEVKFSTYVKPLCLPLEESLRDFDYTDKVLTAVGWGDTSENGEASDIKLKVKLTGVSNEACSLVYSDIVDAQLCAGGVEGEDTW
jgi:secreted trypsin-like serine protease